MIVLYLVFRDVLSAAQRATEAPTSGALKHLDAGIRVVAFAAEAGALTGRW
jgi:hypothetical protein